jgi:hypothetical protein
MIFTPRIRSRVAYAVALHELGHVLGHPVEEPKTLNREVLAWRWAKANALEWTALMERALRYCLGTYIRYAKATAKIWLPPSGHECWSMVGINRTGSDPDILAGRSGSVPLSRRS